VNYALRWAVTAALTFTPIESGADIYRWVDAQGNVEFSDQPREGAKKIEVRDPATISMPKMSKLPPPKTTKTKAQTALYDTLKITFPQNNTAFHSGNGEVTVMMEVNPPLYPNHSLRINLDGAIAGTTKDSYLRLNNVDRGTHALKLDIIDNSSVVKDGPTVTFTIHRPSVN